MKVSKKLEFACRVLAQLGRNYDGSTLLQVDQLASREVISSNYLVQILNDLRNAGLVISRRGKQGGYLLAKHPQDIRLIDIIRAIEPDFLENSITDEGSSGSAVAQAWNGINRALSVEAGKVELTDMIASEETAQMYHI